MTDVEQIKQKINIVDLINEYLPLKKMGRNWRANCPFHSEKTPSFYVSPERGVWHCFGCGKGGDCFSFLMEMERIEFIDALRHLAQKTGIKLTQNIERSTQERRRERLYELHHLTSEYYHFLLTKHETGERARRYLDGRGLREETRRTFFLGYAPNSWEATGDYLRKKGYSDAEILDAGLIIQSSREKGRYYDRFRGRLIFPIHDHRGQTVAFAGRLMTAEVKEAKYINSPETAIYTKGNTLYGLDKTKNAIRKENAAIVVEGEFDLLSSFQDGVTNVVAIKGSALTEGQIGLLKRYTDRLIFALDSDLAGDAAARRGIEIADAAGFLMTVVNLPAGKDPDECVREDKGLWKKAVASAVDIYDYFVSSAKRRNDLTTIEGKKRFSDELMPILAKIDNTIIRAHYTRLVAQELRVAEETIVLAVDQAKRLLKTAVGMPKPPEESDLPKKSRREKLEDLVMAILLQAEEREIVLAMIKNLHREDFTQPAVASVFDHVRGVACEASRVPVFEHLTDVPPELAATFNRLILLDVSEFLTKDRQRWENLLKELERDELRRKIREITTKIGLLDKAEGGLDALNKELTSLTQKLGQSGSK